MTAPQPVIEFKQDAGYMPGGRIVTVHEAMAAVMADVGAVGKKDFNDHQKFNFRGVDSITNAVYGPLCRHGVIVVPKVIDSHYEQVTTSGGKPSRQATLTVRYRFYGPAGDHVDAVTVGEAMDTADKATSKAMAAAFKYALLQTFAIPTEGQDDADAHSLQREPAPAAPPPAPKARVDDLVEWVKREAQGDWVKDQGFVWPWTDQVCDAIEAHLAASDSVLGEQPADATAAEGGPPLSPSAQPGEVEPVASPAPSPELPINGDVDLAAKHCTKCASNRTKRVLNASGAVVCADTKGCAERESQLEEPF